MGRHRLQRRERPRRDQRVDRGRRRPADIIGVGLGAYEACRPWAAGQDTGFKGALFISGLDVGAAAAEVLYNNVVNGAEIPPTTVAKTTIVGPDNYKDVMDATSIANCGG